MLQASTLRFSTDLKANNRKAWIDDHRPAYGAAKVDFVELVSQVLAGLARQDPELARLEPRKCLFSINRDVRLSADKSPYKTNLGAWFNPGGKGAPTAGYYLAIEPGASFLAGGMYLPDPAALAAIRQEIDYNLADFEELVRAPAFRRQVGSLRQEHALKRPPKGYQADNPAIEYLRLKMFLGSRPLPDEQLLSPILARQLLTAYRSLTPLVQYLNRAVGQAA
ncbi:DUF2461 domain-containing protein [Hymenobacter coccineus]|uniref:TIGR02453 family protein n=1 Tax=Hymenobacter coccineus TaxID=1908235 RepID=A0A1G1SU23_9BACT|nr:DUF2461 domain-containing protein [Hymenobacter coccineus]OGX82119.1 TIGR02453 family protein [Hymenobacter coccineus]